MADKGKSVISASTKVEENSFSWHLGNADILNEVRDQGECGCCYSMSAISVCEALFNLENLKKKIKIKLAPQEIVDCLHDRIDHRKGLAVDNVGCKPSNTKKAFEYIIKHGISLEENYAYKGRKDECNPPKDKLKLYIKGFITVDEKASEEVVMGLIVKHPVCCAIDMHEELKKVRSEIYEGPRDVKQKRFGRHAMVLVGYGTENGTQFYWVQNSWGRGWGVEGYGRIRRDLLSKFSYPIQIRPKDGSSTS